MNITDVDDKTIKGANNESTSLSEYTRRYEKAFFEDLENLGIEKADFFPRATEHVKEMTVIIKNLLKNKIAYKSDDGSIYYDISKFRDYGKLSHTKIQSLKERARVKQDSYEKEEARDFALWKSYDKEDADAFWETEIGKGRPGWHIECSAMSMRYLGKHFDIHAGGIDLMFPHHENEIAQSEAFTGKKFANYWFHNEHLLVNGKKMSKSLGNFYTLRDLLDKGYAPKAIRYLLLSAHYRTQLNFTEEALKSAENAVQRLNDFAATIWIFKTVHKEGRGHYHADIKDLITQAKKGFMEKMDDDLNVSEALAVIFDFVKAINIKITPLGIGKINADDIYNFIAGINSVLGVIHFKEDENLEPELRKLINLREIARRQKDFAKADKIRKELIIKGIILEDTKDGVRWKRIRN